MAEHEGKLHLDARIQKAARLQPGTIVENHVVEERAEVGLVDLHGLLHGPGGEAHFSSDDAPSGVDLELDPGRLHRVGVVNGHSRIGDGCGADLAALSLGHVELEDGRADLLPGQHESPVTRCAGL